MGRFASRLGLMMLSGLLAACPGESSEQPDGAPDQTSPAPDTARPGDGPGGADLPASDGDLGAVPDLPGSPDLLQGACGPSTCAGCCTAAQLCVAGTSDIQCGGGGAPCVDCAFKGALCKSQLCTDCTPDCSGKLCGSGDGCGGLCGAGSGCCQPGCSSKYCGQDDGCGSECTPGSGCKMPDCAYLADGDTVALYTFSGSGTTVAEVTGSHPGAIVGSGPTRVSGKTGCDKAMSFTATSPISYVEVPDSSAWDIKQGSVDLWVRFDQASGTDEGLISRDASGTNEPGHFSILRRCNGAIVARLQSTTGEAQVCSKPLAKDTWYHVGVNFGGSGGLKLYINGTPANQTADIICGTSTIACGQSITTGIDGNSNPWVIGASSWNSGDGVATPATLPLRGDLDSVRISKTRRSF